MDTWSLDITSRIIDKEMDIRKIVLNPSGPTAKAKLFNPPMMALDEIRAEFSKNNIHIQSITKNNYGITFILIRSKTVKGKKSILLNKNKTKGCLVFRVLDDV